MELYGISPFIILKISILLTRRGEKSALTEGASAPDGFPQVPESTLVLESPPVTRMQDHSSTV